MVASFLRRCSDGPVVDYLDFLFDYFDAHLRLHRHLRLHLHLHRRLRREEAAEAFLPFPAETSYSAGGRSSFRNDVRAEESMAEEACSVVDQMPLPSFCCDVLKNSFGTNAMCPLPSSASLYHRMGYRFADF